MSKTINAGRVTFVPKDNFSNNISYKKFDIVTYNGSSYFAKKDTIGHTPTEEEFWQLVAEKGQNGEPGAVKTQVVDTLPETGRTDTIYLVKKDNPGEQNLYDKYIYTETGWEHIGDTSVDLSNYQEKLTPGDNINIDNNVISATFQKEVIELTDETIVLKDLEVGIYRITRSVLHIKVGKTNYNTAGYWNCLMFVDYYRSGIKRGYIFSEGYIWCFTDEDYGYTGKSIKDIMSTRAAQTIVATHTYNILPASTVVPVQDNQFTNKKYVDDAVATKQDILTYSMYLPIDTNVTDTEKLQVATDLINNLYKTGSPSASFILSNTYYDTFSNNVNRSMVMNNVTSVVRNPKPAEIVFTSIKNTSANPYNTVIDGYALSIFGTWSDNVFTANRMLFRKNTDPISWNLLNNKFLTKTNTTEYTPTGNYNPATKKYVDDQVGNINTVLATLTTVSEVTK